VPRRREGLGKAVLAALILAGVGVVLAAKPWTVLPVDPQALHESLLNVGVPRQFRNIMDAPPSNPPAWPPVMGADGAAEPSLTPVPIERSAATAEPVLQSPPPQVAEAPAATEPEPVPASSPRLSTLRPEAPAAPPSPALATAPAGFRVQIAATDTDAAAEQAWTELRRALPDVTRERDLQIVVAHVNGREVRRAIVAGFATQAESRAFCARLAAAGRGCLLRGKG
jgi:hypothetical protein